MCIFIYVLERQSEKEEEANREKEQEREMNRRLFHPLGHPSNGLTHLPGVASKPGGLHPDPPSMVAGAQMPWPFPQASKSC